MNICRIIAHDLNTLTFASKLYDYDPKTFPYVLYCAVDTTLISRVWLTKAGRCTPLAGVGARKRGM